MNVVRKDERKSNRGEKRDGGGECVRPHRSPCRATTTSSKVLEGGRKPACYLSFLPLWSRTHTHTYSRSWRATHTHARTCVYTPHMRAPSWKTGSKHTAISSTSGCSARGNELSNSQSSGRTVGSSTGGGNWLVNTFSLFFMGPEWRRGMSLFYLEHPRVGSGGLKLLGVKRFGMIEVNQFIC